MIGEASSVESKQNLVVDAMTMNEGDGWAGSGANPWHLDANTDAVLFLTDEGSAPVRIGLSLTSGGVVYHVTSLKLAAHETRAISIRQLRDAQAADFKGAKIPANAADGAIRWIRLDDVPVTGRLLVINKSAGLASSYDCCYCACPASFNGMSVSPPGTCTCLPGDTYQASATANYLNCNGSMNYYDVTDSATWTSYNTSVSTVNGNGLVTAVGGGQAQVIATGSGTVYEYQCQPNTVTMSSGDTCNVQVLTSVGYINTTTQGAAVCPTGMAGWSRSVTLELLDQNGSGVLVSGISMADSIQISTTENQLGGQDTSTGQHTTNSEGEWLDTYFVCSTACPGSGVTDASQSWTANEASLPKSNAITYKCTSISIDGN